MQFAASLSYLLYAASIAMALPVEKRAGGSTRNDLVNGKCAPVTLIFARGSTEPGNIGMSVGPSLIKHLESSLGANGLAVQGVDYTASIASNAKMGSGGGPVMAKLVAQAKSKCPGTKIALSGYSQGGFVVSYAISKAGVNPNDIAAAVVFGDPSRKAAGGMDKSKVEDLCAKGDGVCLGTFAITAAHLSYSSNGMTAQGANFIVQKTRGGSAGGASSSAGGATAAAPATGSAGGSTGGSGGLGGLSSMLGGGAGGAGASAPATGSTAGYTGDSADSTGSTGAASGGSGGGLSSLTSMFKPKKLGSK